MLSTAISLMLVLSFLGDRKLYVILDEVEKCQDREVTREHPISIYTSKLQMIVNGKKAVVLFDNQLSPLNSDRKLDWQMPSR